MRVNHEGIKTGRLNDRRLARHTRAGADPSTRLTVTPASTRDWRCLIEHIEVTVKLTMTVAFAPAEGRVERIPDVVLHALQRTILESSWLHLPGSRNSINDKVEILEITSASVERPASV